MIESSFGIPLKTKVQVNADVSSDKRTRYIKARIQQLTDDMNKAHDPHDKNWYNRLIQELEWVEQMKSKATHNCYMEANNGN